MGMDQAAHAVIAKRVHNLETVDFKNTRMPRSIPPACYSSTLRWHSSLEDIQPVHVRLLWIGCLQQPLLGAAREFHAYDRIYCASGFVVLPTRWNDVLLALSKILRP